MGSQMDNPRIVVATFCDDIRHEVGQKVSLIGCYGSELIVDKLPALLPKLCAYILFLTPSESPISRLVLRARLNGDVIAEMEVPESVHADLQQKANNSELGRAGVRAMMVFSPLPLNEPCKLQIEAETEEGVVPGSFLRIRERTEDDPAVAGAKVTPR